MQRTAKKCDMTADRFSAGKTTDGLVDNCLENRSRQVFFGSTVVDQRLNVRFGKYTTTCGNWINCLIISSVFI